jgi:hypothetical protein
MKFLQGTLQQIIADKNIGSFSDNTATDIADKNRGSFPDNTATDYSGQKYRFLL